MMDRIVEIWETEIPQYETSLYDLRKSFNRSGDKLDWYERLLTKIQNMNIKKKALAIVIPLMMSVGISQAEIINRTPDVHQEYVSGLVMSGSEAVDLGEKSGYTVYFDTTVYLRDGTPDDVFEKVVDYDNTDLYVNLYDNGNLFTGDIVVTLNGIKIFEDDNGTKLSQSNFDTTMTTNKGDIFKVVISDGGKCYLDVKMSADIATGVENVISDNEFKIYPNPVENTLFIQYDNFDNQELKYQIFSTNGKQVAESNLDIGSGIDVQDLSKGYYILKVIGKNNIITKKFMKK